MVSVSHGDAATVVDAFGKVCPLPVIELARTMGGVEVGAEVLVLADDPGARVDIPVWCRMKSQTLVAVEAVDGGWRFRVRRAV